MKIAVIGSLSQMDDMLKIKMILEEQGNSVIIPDAQAEGDLVDIYGRWLDVMDQADQIIAVPKCWKENFNEENSGFTVKFGEATSYEVAYAEHIGKPVKVLIPKQKGGAEDAND